MQEPTDLEYAMWDRQSHGLVAIGPLMREDQERQDAYDAYCLAQEQDYAEEQAAGGRTICPQCGKRSVTHRSVVTLGYAGHPGAEYSDLAKCESCDYKEV